jgi:hypothetical protein
MRRQLALAAAVVAGLMTITAPAQAKFNVRVVIDGPGLSAPVELFNPGVDIGCVLSRPCDSISHPPARPLGPRYMLTQFLEGHHARGPMMDRIFHDLYPFAPGGPRVFTQKGQTWHEWNRMRRAPGGWTYAPTSLMKKLRAMGLPEEPPAERIATAATAAKRRPREAPESLGVLVGVGVLLVGGAFIGRPRWRRRSPGA